MITAIKSLQSDVKHKYSLISLFIVMALLLIIIFSASSYASGTSEVILDSVNIGDSSDEIGHNLFGFGPIEPVTHGGGWGGADDGSLRVVWYKNALGPEALWHLNENTGDTIYDETSNDNDGLIDGAVWTSGKIDNALSFDGIDDYVDCGNDESLDFSTGDFTISIWVKIKGQWTGGSGSNDNISSILDKGTGHRVDGYGLHFSGNYKKIRFSTDGKNNNMTDGARKDLWNDNKLEYNQWYHVTALRTNGIKYLYINGAQQSNTQIDTREISDTTRHLVLGKHDMDSGGWFNGIIDEVGIWNRALSAQEIQEIYNFADNPSSYPASYPDECWATVDMIPDEGSTATRLEIRALDGIADDSFEIYIDNSLIYSYADQGSTETWNTHSIDISTKKLTGTITVKIKSTGDQWEHFGTYGQLGISWIKLFGSAPDLTTVYLQDSTGSPLQNGIVGYYSGGWKEFGITDSNGQVSKYLPDGKYTFKMTYKGASINKKQDISIDKNVTFSTIETVVKLQDSTGSPLGGGNVSFYAGGWKHFGIIDSDGETKNELLPRTYTFRMTYDGAGINKKQDVSIDSTVIFSTVETTVKLQDNLGNPLTDGTVEYYSGGWKHFGITNDTGLVKNELLPRTYTFKMTYDGAGINKKQDVGVDSTIIFSTVEVTVKLQDSNNNPLSNGNVSFYAGGWKHFGIIDSNGETKNELLPRTYTFRVKYDGAAVNKKQDVGVDSTVIFSTVEVAVKLQNSTGSPLRDGNISYYSAGWKFFGTTDVNGEVKNELLPRTYTFKMTYKGASINKKQDISIDKNVTFSTIETVVKLQDSTGSPLGGGNVSFYAGGWKYFGMTDVNGEVKNELLPRTYTFKMIYNGAAVNKKQDVNIDPVVIFSTVEVTVKLQNSTGSSLSDGNISYYAGGWKFFGMTDVTGEVRNELLPRTYTFRVKYDGAAVNKKQDVSVDPIVVFSTVEVTVKLQDSIGNLLSDGSISYYSGGWKFFGITDSNGQTKNELLPRTFTFRAIYNGTRYTTKQNVGEDSIVIIKTDTIDNYPPVADANGPYFGYLGEVIKFNGSKSYDPDGNIINYTWDFGDGNISYDVKSEHIYTQIGDYIVNLTVIDNEGLVDYNITYVKIAIKQTNTVVNNNKHHTSPYNYVPSDPVSEEIVDDIIDETVEEKVNSPPIAKAVFSVKSDEEDSISFDASASCDPDGDELSYRWDFDNDGEWDTDYSKDPLITYRYSNSNLEGHVRVEVFDGEKSDEVIVSYVVESCVEPLKEVTIKEASSEKQYYLVVEWWFVFVSIIFSLVLVLYVYKKRYLLINNIKTNNFISKDKQKRLCKIVSIIFEFLYL